MWCPRIVTVSKSTRSRASSITIDILPAVLQIRGDPVREFGVQARDAASVRPLSSFDDRRRDLRMLLDRLQQHLLLDRFRQKGRAPRRQTLFSIAFQGGGGQGDDRRGRPVVRLFPRPNRPRRGQAIHDRHLPVHQDKIVVSGCKHFTGDGSGLGDLDPVRRVLQIGHRDRAVVGGVLRQKNTQRRQRRLGIRADRHDRRPIGRRPRFRMARRRKTRCPCPHSLSTQMRPPINSTRRLEIVSPSPEPPNLRVVDESACVKRSNTRPNFWPECRCRCRRP